MRTGIPGYPISVWQHDARAFLTPETDELRGEGNGMGILLQLGPKFIIQQDHNLQSAVKNFLNSLWVNGKWPINITRLDLAIDLFGISMAEQDINNWLKNWVGMLRFKS